MKLRPSGETTKTWLRGSRKRETSSRLRTKNWISLDLSFKQLKRKETGLKIEWNTSKSLGLRTT